MGKAGYRTGGRHVWTAYQVSEAHQDRAYWDARRELKVENCPTKGPKILAIEAYENGGIDKLNEYFLEMNRRLYPRQVSRDVVLAWVKDIIKLEDVGKFGILVRGKNYDDAR